MQAFFRVDASLEIGSGHFMRCLTLADGLKEQGVVVSFISRDLPGNMNDFISEKGWKIFRLPYRAGLKLDNCQLQHEHWLNEHWRTDSQETLEILNSQGVVDWLIVDHYALDHRWETSLRQSVNCIMAIDDLADRLHDVDLLLDQTLHENMECRYLNLVPDSSILLLGPQYALLRKEFANKRQKLRNRNGELHRVLVFFGGSDASNATKLAVQAFISMRRDDIIFDIVVGGLNPARGDIMKLCREAPNFNFYCQVENMAELIEQADLAFGAAGASIWERLCLGVPSVVISVADNQMTLLQGVINRNIMFYMGEFSSLNKEHFIQTLDKFLGEEGTQYLIQLSANALGIVDGAGCDRVVSSIIGYSINLSCNIKSEGN